MALEQHKKVMTVHLSDLSSKIEHLTDSQQAKSAFPSLSKIDSTDKFNRESYPEAIPELNDFAEELQHRIARAEENTELYFRLSDIQLLLGGLAMSQLHVFHGISGTGKTSLVKAFAKAMGGHCTDISVQAGWRDRDGRSIAGQDVGKAVAVALIVIGTLLETAVIDSLTTLVGK